MASLLRHLFRKAASDCSIQRDEANGESCSDPSRLTATPTPFSDAIGKVTSLLRGILAVLGLAPSATLSDFAVDCLALPVNVAYALR